MSCDVSLAAVALQSQTPPMSDDDCICIRMNRRGVPAAAVAVSPSIDNEVGAITAASVPLWRPPISDPIWLAVCALHRRPRLRFPFLFIAAQSRC